MSPPSPKSDKWVPPRLLLAVLLAFSPAFPTPSLSYSASSIPASSSSRVSYTAHCNSVVPRSTPKYTSQSPSTFPQLRTGYFHGGDGIISQNDSSNSRSLRFRTHDLYYTNVDGVFMVDGVLILRVGTMNYQPVGGNFSVGDYNSSYNNKRFRTRRPRFHRRMDRISFRLNGFWSESSGKLCMVGTGTGYSKQGNLLDLSVVFKLHYPSNSTIFTTLVPGTLESVDGGDTSNYFEPISVLVYSQRNYTYNYTLISKVDVRGFRKESALSLDLKHGQDVCSQLYDRSAYNLEYSSDCNAPKKCSPFIGVGGLPEYMFFDDIQCSDKGRLRLLVGFSNSSYNMYNQPLLLGRMLVGEGVWSEDYNRLDVVACRVSNFSESLVKASIGDCSVRLSMWFPAFLSIKNRSSPVGQLWSNKTVGEPGYFDKIEIQGFTNRVSVLPGLKYDYTEIGKVLKSCPKKTAAKGKEYPSVYSDDMRFDIRVKNKKGQHAWGYSAPLSLGAEFYESAVKITYAAMAPTVSVPVYDTLTPITSVPVHNESGNVNVSYSIRITPDYQVNGLGSSSDLSLNLNAPVEISAEGIYDTETGSLCMVGCRYVKSSNNHSNDCEIQIIIQFRPVGAESSEYVKGTIKSTRVSSDPLYFEELQLSAISLSSGQATESIWRMDLEITLVLVSNTLICIFVCLQIFYVKKHPDALPSISLFMLALLTLGQMIPLVLNFEALFLKSHNPQNVMMGSGGWLEVNEVLVRVITMVSFLLQFRLLQLTWSSRSADGNKKSVAIAEKKALYVLIPLYLVGAFLAWGMHWWNSSYEAALQLRNYGFYPGHSLWGDLRSYAGLLLDGFLLPQILFNMFWNSKDKSLHPVFYVGITSVRLLPHAYDLYRAHSYTNYYDASYIYANPRGDLFSTAWDVIIPFGGLLFAILIFLQQRFGGCCIIPPRFRQPAAYEKVPVANGE